MNLISKAHQKYRTRGFRGVLFGLQGFLARNKNKFVQKYYTLKVRNTAEDCGGGLLVRYPSQVTENTILGEDVSFNNVDIRGDGKVKIGNNFEGGPNILILTRNHAYDSGESLPFDDTYNRKTTVIEDNVWIGAEVTLVPGVTIGEGAIIQAGSTVVDDIPPFAIAGGHPAEVFDERNKEHYRKLKKKQNY
jgi:chloramphenicol O-acetyltransferase type B